MRRRREWREARREGMVIGGLMNETQWGWGRGGRGSFDTKTEHLFVMDFYSMDF